MVGAVGAVNITATADDLNGEDDEDGVTLPTGVQLGQTRAMTVNVTNLTTSTAFLNIWIDFNQNGVLTDPGERVASNITVSGWTWRANRTVNFSVPLSATLGDVGVRVRLTSNSSPGSTGNSGRGEVEDYVMNIAQISNLDYGDLPDVASGTGVGEFRTRSAAKGPSQ